MKTMKWLVIALVLVVGNGAVFGAERIPVRFSGSWCVEDLQITVGPNFVEGSKLRCEIPQWVELKGPVQVDGVLHDIIPGRPIIVLMECHHKFDKTFKKLKQGQIWAIGDDEGEEELSITDMENQKFLRAYHRCEDEDAGSHGPGTMNDADFYKSEEWKRMKRESR